MDKNKSGDMVILEDISSKDGHYKFKKELVGKRFKVTYIRQSLDTEFVRGDFTNY